jgi:hypothetical protein
MGTLLIAVMFLAAFQLGRLVTRDDEQREVEVVRARKSAVKDLAMAAACSRGAGSGSSTRPTSGAPSGDGRWRSASSPGSTARRSRTLATTAR